MKNVLTAIHNFIHDTAIKIDIWAKANPTQALLVGAFFIGIIIGALVF